MAEQEVVLFMVYLLMLFTHFHVGFGIFSLLFLFHNPCIVDHILPHRAHFANGQTKTAYQNPLSSHPIVAIGEHTKLESQRKTSLYHFV